MMFLHFRPHRSRFPPCFLHNIVHNTQVKTGKASDNGKVYPNYESAKDDEGLFNLPVREPGSFPEPSVHTPQGMVVGAQAGIHL